MVQSWLFGYGVGLGVGLIMGVIIGKVLRGIKFTKESRKNLKVVLFIAIGILFLINLAIYFIK